MGGVLAVHAKAGQCILQFNTRSMTGNQQPPTHATCTFVSGKTRCPYWLSSSDSCVAPAGKLKAKNLVEFLKPFAGPKGGAAADAKKPAGTTDGAAGSKSGSGGANKPFAEQPAGSGTKAKSPKAASRRQEAEAAEDVQDPVSAVVDLTADDLPAVLEGDDAWLFGVFDGEWGPPCRMT